MQKNQVVEKYYNKLLKEFKKAYGIKDSNYSIFLLKEWFAKKRQFIVNYVQLLEYMRNYDDVEMKSVVEIGKGIFDTITLEMVENIEHQPTVISLFAETMKDCGVQAFTGELTVNNDEVFVKYPREEDYYTNPNCNPYFNNDIDTLMIQAPFSDKEIFPFLKLVNSSKTLFIGTYGSLDDKDYKENLQGIENLYHELRNISSRNIELSSETQNGAYLSAIKISSQQKKLRKSPSRF